MKRHNSDIDMPDDLVELASKLVAFGDFEEIKKRIAAQTECHNDFFDVLHAVLLIQSNATPSSNDSGIFYCTETDIHGCTLANEMLLASDGRRAPQFPASDIYGVD